MREAAEHPSHAAAGSRKQEFVVRNLDAPLGAEIVGIDLARPLSRYEVDRLRRAWLDRQVLLFRGQTLSDPELIAFSKEFGDLEFPPSRLLNYSKGSGQSAGIPPEINVISNVKENGKPIGQLGHGEAAWHTDSSFVDEPPAGSVIYALEVPPSGGDTSFLDMYKALETLPADLRSALEGRRIKHDPSYTSVGARRADFAEVTDVSKGPGPSHPAIRTHPETGRKALYLGRRLAAWVVGMPVADSEALLDRVWAHVLQGRFVWTHQWRVGDAVMWDNRCVMHRRESFDSNVRRIMHRTQLKGDRPR